MCQVWQLLPYFYPEQIEAYAHAWGAAGASQDIIVTPHDNHGNAGASGGRFAAELVPEDDEAAPPLPCQVTESTTGQHCRPYAVAWDDLFAVFSVKGEY